MLATAMLHADGGGVAPPSNPDPNTDPNPNPNPNLDPNPNPNHDLNPNPYPNPDPNPNQGVAPPPPVPLLRLMTQPRCIVAVAMATAAHTSMVTPP
eukprot:scaffold21325_cov70-Phaeocystis_antarctica.AAC.1